VIAALDARRVAEQDDRPDAAILAALVDRANVIALVHRGRLNGKPTGADCIDQRERVDRLVIASGADVPRERKIGCSADSHVELEP
jgi:hypothetical protein